MRTNEFASAGLPEGQPYHRLGRNSRYRWWTPPLTLSVLGILLVFLWIAMVLAITIVAVIGGSGLAPDTVSVGEVAGLAFGLAPTALLIPIVLFVVRVVQWRRVGTLMSVEGRMRWRWLLRCLAAALVPVGVCLIAFLFLVDRLAPGAAPVRDTGGAEVFAAAVLVIVLLVPFQAAAEELTVRGLMMQLVGSLGAGPGERRGGGPASRVLRSPGTAVLAGGTLVPVLYAATHPDDPWVTSSLTVMGLGMAWLTWRTGGVEAAIGLHVVSSLVQFLLTAYEGRLSEVGTGAVLGAGLPPGAGTPLGLALAVVQVGVYALGVSWLADRGGVRRVSALARR
ncbi:CPBP family intramembrane glutamic endopeptidase [Nocardiopsis sp. Huas11]|uniref:CPBP family intramembrane glutamic endopeptidase n=1 Tax=Nocardiopsis sp. Huas11 TaxID=2183912 RepID=UPI000EB18ADB|nr:CPBP family intramembrane glutamic endopeptidase [Nocardiopsis sp. Huas11]